MKESLRKTGTKMMKYENIKQQIENSLDGHRTKLIANEWKII